MYHGVVYRLKSKDAGVEGNAYGLRPGRGVGIRGAPGTLQTSQGLPPAEPANLQTPRVKKCFFFSELNATFDCDYDFLRREKYYTGVTMRAAVAFLFNFNVALYFVTGQPAYQVSDKAIVW